MYANKLKHFQDKQALNDKLLLEMDEKQTHSKSVLKQFLREKKLEIDQTLNLKE